MLQPIQRIFRQSHTHSAPSVTQPARAAGLLLALWFAGLAAPALGGVGEGQELYDGYCSVCHGGLGEGQPMGKPLTDSMANRLDDAQLLAVIAEGRAGTGMAAWGGTLSEEEIFDVASYIRTLQGKPGLSLGDDGAGASDDPRVAAGEDLFNGIAGCAACHSYRDQGGTIGPALDGVSADIPPTGLVNALLNPSARITEGYEAKQIELNDGTIVRGRFRNDSELAVQLQSEDGKRWVTYFKDRVKSVTDLEESLMPAVYGDLTTEQQEQLIAFLNSL